MKASDSSISVDGKKVYLDENTLFVSVDGVGSKIDVTAATGGMKASGDVTIYAVVADSDGKTGKLVFIAGDDLSTSGATEDIVYLAGDASEKNSSDTYVTDDLWFMKDLTNTAGMIITDDITEQGFYTYSVNDDKEYKLEDTDSLKLSADYDDEKGFVEGLTVLGVYSNRSVTFAENHFDGDINFNNVTIIDTRSSKVIDSSLYPTEINTIADLKDAVETAGTVTVDAYFDDGVTFIAVTAVEKSVYTNIDNASDLKDTDAYKAYAAEDDYQWVEDLADSSYLTYANVKVDGNTITVKGKVTKVEGTEQVPGFGKEVSKDLNTAYPDETGPWAFIPLVNDSQLMFVKVTENTSNVRTIKIGYTTYEVDLTGLNWAD